jgi:hypothetical protein
MILIRRVLAGIGLVLLVPVAVGLITGSINLADAGVRAATVFGVILVLRKLLPKLVIWFADTLDGTWRGEPPVTDPDAEEASAAKEK